MHHRLTQICQDTNITLDILSREKAPKLLDTAAWDALPADQFDVVILDSFGGATPGISEKEGRLLQQALGTLQRVADRGPAVIVLENTNKTALAYRGRGEKTERVDAFYEVRDVTNWTPPRAEYWWEHLPSGDDAEWQHRASRRTKQDQIRLAFVCRKFRWGEEPNPFVVEIDFAGRPWSLADVTDEMARSGADAEKEARHAEQQRLKDAAHALVRAIRTRDPETPCGKTEAIDFLHAAGLTRAQARNLLEAYNAPDAPRKGCATLQPIPGSRGRGGTVAVVLCSVNVPGNNVTSDIRHKDGVELNIPDFADRHQSHRQKYPILKPPSLLTMTIWVLFSPKYPHYTNRRRIRPGYPRFRQYVW